MEDQNKYGSTLPKKMQEHQIYGTTIEVGKTELQTIYGKMTAYVFQNLIHKGYVIALAHGDIHAKTLYTRLHSSCITSQLMRSLDCDCVQQLQGSIKKICEGNGILFYLMQEGRGCGYVGKSRDRMTVQYYEQQKPITTFQAYEMLGLKHDYRQYSDVKDIVKILGIDPEFILLTNNPDKIQKFENLGLKCKAVESIQVPPNPFNQKYLMSKEQYGHILYQAKAKVEKCQVPFERIKPFNPYSISDCRRFVLVSSYYLPIKPVWGRVLLTTEQYAQFQDIKNKSFQLVRNPSNRSELSYYVQLTRQQLLRDKTFIKPTWFQIFVHYDLVKNQDYLILKYGNCEDPNKIPVVRIHSQSMFNRFPLIDRKHKDRYKLSIDKIIQNGCGIIVILYNDGRGSGLAYYIMNQDQDNQKRKTIGVEQDNRDYPGAIRLLKSYINPENPIDILYGENSKVLLKYHLQKSNIKVRNYIKLIRDSEQKGINSIQYRMTSLNIHTDDFISSIDQNNFYQIALRIKAALQNRKQVYCTGIGSSQAHSKYLETIFNEKIRHINPMNVRNIRQDDYLLIAFSQGLSPNALFTLYQQNPKNILLITSITEDNTNTKKVGFLKKIKQNSQVLSFPKENPDNTLIRVTGPFIGFCIGLLLKRLVTQQSLCLESVSRFSNNLKQEMHQHFKNENRFPDHFIENVTKTKNIVLVCDYPAINVIDNVRYKIIEGGMVNCHKIDYINFAHGTFQFIENTKNFCVWFITKKSNTLHKKAQKILSFGKDFIETTYYQDDQLPFKIELQSNHMVFQLVQILNVNQTNWPGKEREMPLYLTDKDEQQDQQLVEQVGL